MQKNEMIGIAGVFLLTFCLIALYHFIGLFSRHRKRYDAQIKQAKEPNQDRGPDDPLRSSGKDDAWLLWSPELGTQSGDVRKGLAEHREKEISLRGW
jgi:hypothetical protein